MSTIQIQCETGKVSDGYHTFDELYEHRHALFLALMSQCDRYKRWYSLAHSDGSKMEGWFIAGIDLPSGPITYHLPIRLVATAQLTGAEYLELGQAWDGHTSGMVIDRLFRSVEIGAGVNC